MRHTIVVGLLATIDVAAFAQMAEQRLRADLAFLK
jgi:hypothetical protein